MIVRRPWRRLDRRLRRAFPVVDGNAVRPLGVGAEYFAVMEAAIRGAHSAIDVEMYLWEDDAVGRRFLDALTAAALRGLRVRVLADAFGSREVLDGLRELLANGAVVHVFNPFRVPFLRRFYHRTHKKLVVLDEETAYCGGAGFSVHFSGIKRREEPWHDHMFEIRGPLVQQLATSFVTDFGRFRAIGGQLHGPLVAPPADPRAVGVARGRVLRGWPDARDFPTSLLRAVRAARERILLATPYFLPPRALRRALRLAERRGVRVEIVLPAAHGANPVLWYASRRHYGGMLKRGVSIYEYGPRFYHAKLAVVDDDHAFVGSSNIDPLSWRTNAELDLVFHDAASVAMVADLFGRDRDLAQEVTLEDHRARGILHRVFERLAGLFDRWM